ncbi:cation transporting ATPase C-terminal domain-containing protein [Streptomyces sp. NPDC088124]|uniref:cation transporting ATPase C-terminal domain-containing protein n=1 Tax=Streptomyces sp. NPDC088124 TaxID=3154654 RepID=UPI0034206EE8
MSEDEQPARIDGIGVVGRVAPEHKVLLADTLKKKGHVVAQVLWIHFVVNASFGFALGFDRESPGLMRRRPRPRGEPVLTRPVRVTVGIGGLAITVVLLGLIKLGQAHFDSVGTGRSIAFTALALLLLWELGKLPARRSRAT